MSRPVTINVPSLPADWHSTAVGVLGSIAILLKPYLATGTVKLEQVALAIFVAVVCYFIPAKPGAKDQAAMVATITGIVDNVVGAKLPAILTQERQVNDLEKSALDVVTAATVQEEAPGLPTVAAS